MFYLTFTLNPQFMSAMSWPTREAAQAEADARNADSLVVASGGEYRVLDLEAERRASLEAIAADIEDGSIRGISAEELAYQSEVDAYLDRQNDRADSLDF